MRKEIAVSFDIVCSGCGAPSSPSVGVCPFCKTVMAKADGESSPTSEALSRLYQEGNLVGALNLATGMLKAKPELSQDLSFALCYAKILIEAEGPSSRIRSVLGEAHISAPQNPEILDYLEIIEAKNLFKKGANDPGESALRKLLRRSPTNVHAHFLLGTHLFWVENDLTGAIPHLETCVRLHSNFLRAWGCLGAIYKKLGNAQLAQTAFRKCASLETNPAMREFFLKESSAAG